MKYSKKFDRNYDFYLQNKDQFAFSGVKVTVKFDPQHGVSGKEAFHKFDTTGIMVGTTEPELLISIINCKKSINLHIKMWVEGYEDMMEGIDFYINQFRGEPPSWVEDSLRKQLKRQMRRQQKSTR